MATDPGQPRQNYAISLVDHVVGSQQGKPKQHRKGGNIVYHKKLTGLILLENVHHIIVTEILEKPNSVLLTSWIDGSQLYSNHTWCRVNGLNGVLGRFKTSLSSEDLQDLVWCYIFSFIKLV